ncbi:MAG: alpha/beta hydrolase [Bacteroidota bacterium]
MMKSSVVIAVFLFSFLGLVAQNRPEALASMQDLEYVFPTQKAKLANGMELAYVDEGSGEEVLLFVHGLGSYIPAWRKNIVELRRDFRCIAVDLPGYGKSSKGKYSGTLPFFAEQLIALLDHLNIEQVTLVGHSMGGQISMVTALQYPDRIKRLVLCAPAGFETFNEGQKEWFREVITANGVRLTPVESIKANLGSNFLNFPKDAEFMIDDRIAMRSAEDFPGYCYIIPKSVQAMVDMPVYDELPNITQPVQVIFGKQDNLIPNRFLNPGSTTKIAEDGASRIPNAQLNIVNKAGHFVMFEQAEEVNQIIRAFMAK